MAKHDKLTLTISKPDQLNNFPLLKYSSTERGKIVDVTVLDTDNTPYDLSGVSIYFIEELYNGELIVDDGREDKSGAFSNTNLKNGQFSYQFQEGIYQYDGWSHFKFNKNGETIDTTEGFAIKIIEDGDSALDEASYIAYFEEIQKEHQNWIARAEDLIGQQQKLNADNKKLTQDAQTTMANAKTDILNQVKQNNYTKTEVNSIRDNALSTLRGEIKSKGDQLQGNINQKANSSDLTPIRNDISNISTRTSALEKAGYVKGKFSGFKSAEEAKQWAMNNHGIAIFDD